MFIRVFLWWLSKFEVKRYYLYIYRSIGLSENPVLCILGCFFFYRTRLLLWRWAVPEDRFNQDRVIIHQLLDFSSVLRPFESSSTLRKYTVYSREAHRNWWAGWSVLTSLEILSQRRWSVRAPLILTFRPVRGLARIYKFRRPSLYSNSFLHNDRDRNLLEFRMITLSIVFLLFDFNVTKLFWLQEQKRKLFHTSIYESEIQLKKLYIQTCRRLPAFHCKVFQVKELMRGKTKKRVSL